MVWLLQANPGSPIDLAVLRKTSVKADVTIVFVP